MTGCASATVNLGGPPDTAQGTDSADSGSDSGQDTGTTTDSGDTAADTGHTGDSGSPDTGNPDTGTTSVTSYSGQVQGTLTYSDPHGEEPNQTDCSGQATFTITGDGSLTGQADCGTGPQGVTGDLLGSVSGTSITATWTVHVGPDAVQIPLNGAIAGSNAGMHGEVSFGSMGQFTVTITSHS